MPNIAQTVVTTQEVKIAPALRRKLLTELHAYATLKGQLDVIKLAMDKRKAVIGGLRDDTGCLSISLEGFKTMLVSPIRKKFNPRTFVANGGDLAIYNQSIDDVPSKSYEKISLPGEKDTHDD